MSASASEPLLLVEHLGVEGRDLALVEDVSFTIARGQTLCLVGESGSSKSLTARAILRLVDPPLSVHDASRILLAGRDRASSTPQSTEIRTVQQGIQKWLDICEKEGRNGREPVTRYTLDNYEYRGDHEEVRTSSSDSMLF